MNSLQAAPSGATQKFALAVLGLSDYEMRLVRSVISLTMAGGRQINFQLSNDCAHAEIALLDADSAVAVAEMQNLLSRADITPPVVLTISTRTTPAGAGFHLQRPLAPSKLLHLLDHIANELSKVKRPQAVASSIAVAATQTLSNSLDVITDSPIKPGQLALIIDDSPTARIKITQELRDMHINSDCAETGELGLYMLSQKNYDLIFLDIIMPGADGYDVCKIIRRHPEHKKVPVIMLTSKSSPFDRIRGTMAGCTNYLTKPVEHQRFRATVEKCLADYALLNQHKRPGMALST